jgi:hypothetical protein
MRYIRAASVLAVVDFREPGMLPLLRMVPEAIRSLAPGARTVRFVARRQKSELGFCSVIAAKC